MAATQTGPSAAGVDPAPPSVLVIRMVAEESSRPEGEQIPLLVERRLFLKRRWRAAAKDGTEFGFDLESRLKNGCVIHRTETRDYVVWQEHEPVYTVRPASLDEAALLGWKIGNLHMPVEILGGEIRAQHDPAVKQLLEREGYAFTEQVVLFQPLRVAAHAPDWLPWLLQVNDSQFPSGAYAHSLGLEELVQRGVVANAGDLERFLHDQILPGLLAFELPFLVKAHAAAASGDMDSLRLMNVELDGWKLAAELRSASRKLGSRRLALVRRLASSPELDRYAECSAPCHHLIVCALELRSTPVMAVQCAFAYQTLSGYAYAAMKLLRLGQESAQSLVRGAMTTLIAGLRPESATADNTRIGWFNPLLEIASMRHARAAERLFIS